MWKSACILMDKRITVEQLSDARNSFGEPVPTWTVVKTVWASIEPISGKEFFQARQEQSEVTHRIKTKASGITPDMRVKYGSRIFTIMAVINEGERGAMFTVMAKEVI